MENDTKNLHPIEVLIEELKCEDISRRAISVTNLNTIAIALGPKQAREELLPYLLELLDDDNEVLLALAQSIRFLLPSIGGKKYAFALCDLIEQLLIIDENSIRNMTLESFKNILAQADSQFFCKAVFDLIKRLCNSEKVPAKIAAAYLIPCTLEKSDGKKPYFDQFKLLLLCSHPQVRVAAAENLKSMGKYNEGIVELLNIATVDQEDTVRLLASEALLLCNNCKGLITSITALFEDDYWKVKQKLAENLSLIGKFLSPQLEMVFEYFKKISEDKEIEVRLALCRNISELFKIVPKKDLEKYVDVLNNLGNDTMQVKTALALEINKIWKFTGKNDQLSRILQNLTSSYSAQISLNLLENIQNLQGNNSNFEGFLKLQLELLLKDKQWRIRQSLANYIKAVKENIDEMSFAGFFKDTLLELAVDSAFCVRETAAEVFSSLILFFGLEWYKKNFLSPVLELAKSENYIHRMSCCNILRLTYPECPTESIEKSIFILLEDPVCNVRAYALKSLIPIYNNADQGKKSAISNSLTVLQCDSDLEVQNLLSFINNP